VTISYIGSTPTCVGELHRWAETTWAIADTLEAGQAARADVAAGAAIVVVAAGRNARAVAVHLAFGAAKSAGTPADTLEAGLAGWTHVAALSTMGIVAARIDADTVTFGLTLRTASAGAADAATTNTTSTWILTGTAMSGIRGEVTATVDSAAVLHTNGAVCTLADSAPALDGNETALADLAAGPAVVHVGLQIDAGTGAVGEPRLTGRGFALRGQSMSRAAAGDSHRG
jgi:hypothetical protein